MNRKDFIKALSLLGLSAPASGFSLFQGAESGGGNFRGDVLIIGAGAAGIAAAYLLEQQGIEYQVIEAAASYGGRFRTNTTFTDFPISLGAEWLHVPEKELGKIVRDKRVPIETRLKAYDSSDTYGYYEDEELTVDELGWGWVVAG